MCRRRRHRASRRSVRLGGTTASADKHHSGQADREYAASDATGHLRRLPGWASSAMDFATSGHRAWLKQPSFGIMWQSMNYQVTSSDKAVQVWSAVRPPFEPKGWLMDLRSEIRNALVRLSRPTDRLYSHYASSQAGLCDVQHILFYTGRAGNCRGLDEHEVVVVGEL